METQITIQSHNIRGFNNSKEFLLSQSKENPFLIQAIQEHWLPPPYKRQAGVNKLRTLHPDFEGFGVSAMKKSMENEIRRGRPFGGTGFIYPKGICESLSPLTKYNHDRLSVMELTTEFSKIIIINVYLPFLDRTNLHNVTCEY